MGFATSCTSSPSPGSCAGNCMAASAAGGLDPAREVAAEVEVAAAVAVLPRLQDAVVAAVSEGDGAAAESVGLARGKRRTEKSVQVAFEFQVL